MKRTSLAVAVLLSAGLVAMASAHESDPAGDVFFAFQFEDGAVPVIDGHLDDWSFVPEFYFIPGPDWNVPQRHFEGGGELDANEEDLASFNPTAAYGWNESNNRMYVYMEAVDDYHQIERDNAQRVWLDDDFEHRWMPADVAESEMGGYGDVGLDGTAKIFQGCAFPALAADPQTCHMIPGFDYALLGGPVVEIGWSYEGVMLGEGVSTYRYEIGTEIYWTIAETIEETTMLDLEEGHVMHVTTYMNDKDGTPDETFFSTAAIELQRDLQLAELDDTVEQIPTSVEQASWGQIKTGFSN